MSEAPPRPPPPSDAVSQQLAPSTRGSAAYDTPPPPPPKPQSPRAHGGPPPTPGDPSYSDSLSQAVPSQPSGPPPPSIEDGWLPEGISDLSKPDLERLVADPALLDALIHAPSNTHPSLPASATLLQAHLARNVALAQHLNGQAAALVQQREELTSRLLQLRALERQWKLKQGAMDDALAPFSPKALHARLVGGIAEQEQLLSALEESFIEEDGKAGDRDINDFIKRWREGRKVLVLRTERRRRFEEGRVGGWR